LEVSKFGQDNQEIENVYLDENNSSLPNLEEFNIKDLESNSDKK